MEYNTFTLGCGLRVIHLASASPVVYCGYQVNAGTRDELPGEEGLAHFCEHNTFKGTARRSAMQILNGLESVGGSLNAFTNKEDTVFYAAISRDHLARAVDLLTDIVFHSTYPQAEIDKEVEVICDEIESYNDSPSELIYDEFEGLLFGGHPLGRGILGRADRLRTFCSADVLAFARRLFGYSHEASAIELKLEPGTDAAHMQEQLARLLGDRFVVQNRYEQQADVFRIMEIEKFISYLFLTFILVVACFNVIGSLSMLILDKRDDVATLRNLGADDRLITRVFLFEGRLISFFGAVAGIVLGLLLCCAQQRFGLVSMGTGNAFVTDAYPVSVHADDLLLVFLTVMAVGFLAVWYPVRYLSRRLLSRR